MNLRQMVSVLSLSVFFIQSAAASCAQYSPSRSSGRTLESLEPFLNAEKIILKSQNMDVRDIETFLTEFKRFPDP